MKFPSFFGGAPKTPEPIAPVVEKVEEPYSVENLSNLLRELDQKRSMSAGVEDHSYAGDNSILDKILEKIIDQLNHLPDKEIIRGFRESGLDENAQMSIRKQLDSAFDELKRKKDGISP